MRRDVLTVPKGSYAIIRIVSDIPGVHAFHCKPLVLPMFVKLKSGDETKVILVSEATLHTDPALADRSRKPGTRSLGSSESLLSSRTKSETSQYRKLLSTCGLPTTRPCSELTPACQMCNNFVGLDNIGTLDAGRKRKLSEAIKDNPTRKFRMKNIKSHRRLRSGDYAHRLRWLGQEHRVAR